jgi:integrase
MARNIYHRKDGRFEGRYVKSYDEDGKKLYGSVFGKTYIEVKKKLESVPPANTRESHAASHPAVTVVGAVTAHLESLKHQIKPSTKGTYQRYLDNHIAPYFGNTHCDCLTPEMVQNFIDKQVESGLSAVTVQYAFSFLKAGLRSVGGGIFSVKLPKKPRGTVEYLSLDEQKRLETAAKESGTLDYLTITLCLYTGVRIGEVCGLQWPDIDFERKTLHVRRTMQRIPSDGEAKTAVALLSPKSGTSSRDIPLPDFLLEMLKAERSLSVCEYVLSQDKKAVEPRTVQRHFKRLLVTAEVKDVNFHTTRHTFATRALESGFDIKSLSEILGHGSATITLNKYAHALDEHKRNCMNGLSAVFSKA